MNWNFCETVIFSVNKVLGFQILGLLWFSEIVDSTGQTEFKCGNLRNFN